MNATELKEKKKISANNGFYEEYIGFIKDYIYPIIGQPFKK